MRGDLSIRKTKTASGAIAVQVVRYRGKRSQLVKHIGSAHDEAALEVLITAAQEYLTKHCKQPDLFSTSTTPLLHVSHTKLHRVTHRFARDSLHRCACLCGLSDLPPLYIDLALMRIIEPASKLRTIELLQRYFDVTYSERTVYRLLPKLLDHKEAIETAAIQTALNNLKETFSLVLYDVTTLYFESFKEYEFQKPGFSKDNKPQQPQIVIGLLVTRSGFPVMHEVFEGNTFEGHTMLEVIKRFQERFDDARPIIVADAAMLSRDNMKQLDEKGYHYIVGARLANTSMRFIDEVDAALSRADKECKRFIYTQSPKNTYSIICEFSEKRYKKDKREFDKQVKRAQTLIQSNEPGRRAKFVKKSDSEDKLFTLDEALKKKTEKLLGIKGYATNISKQELADPEVISYYRDLWHVEQAFRMSKSDLKTRPIFHRKEGSIRAHVLACFVSLMLGKYLEIKTGFSLRRIRDHLWQIHEAEVYDELTGEKYTLRTEINTPEGNKIAELLKKPH